MNTIYQDAYLKAIGSNDSRFEQLKNKLENSQFNEQNVIMLLNIAIVDQQLAELNYLASYNLSTSQGKADCDPEFKAHQDQQRDHKHDLIQRLRQLGSPVPTIAISEWYQFNSQGNLWKQETLNNTFEILKNRIKEQQDAIEFYTLAVNYTRGSNDTTTYTLFKKIKEDQEEHLLDLSDLAREYGLIEKINNPVKNNDLDEPTPKSSKVISDSEEEL